ncbi:MAG: cytochrome P450 [Deltaproteobacteria bacterium]|nr:cytochrome P450 [Myxococcales bacterium]MDP3218452.1 cytochrome P450 [Deltaproteobacteria bacterium]
MSLPPGPDAPTPWILVRWMRDPVALLDECRARYGETFTIRLGAMPPLVILSNPEHVREVFASAGDDMHGGKIAEALRPFLGERSVIVLDGAEHKTMRRLVMPPFHGERMHAYGREMVELTHASIDRWPVGREFPIHEPLQGITLDVILRTVFGMDDAGERAALGAQLSRLTHLASWPPLLLPQMQRDLGPWSPWGRFVRESGTADANLLGAIARRRREGADGRTDILSMLLGVRDEDGRGLDDQDLRDQLVTLLVAGHETTATALAWTLRWVLALPDVRDRLLSELHAAQRSGPLTPERIAKLEYLDGTVREALRLQPVIPLVGRVLQQPMRFAGYDLPAGVALAPSVHLVHQNTAVYSHPARFDPTRFIGRQYKGHEWIPFGGGIRKCIGMAFAIYEMKMVLATVLSRAWLRSAPGYVPRAVRRSITLTPSRGMPVIVDAVLPRGAIVPAAA